MKTFSISISEEPNAFELVITDEVTKEARRLISSTFRTPEERYAALYQGVKMAGKFVAEKEAAKALPARA